MAIAIAVLLILAMSFNTIASDSQCTGKENGSIIRGNTCQFTACLGGSQQKAKQIGTQKCRKFSKLAGRAPCGKNPHGTVIKYRLTDCYVCINKKQVKYALVPFKRARSSMYTIIRFG